MLDPGEKVTKRLLTITGNYGVVSRDDPATIKFLSAFPEPGEYEVRVVYRLGEEVYSSNTLRVAVTPPPANGVAALEYFKAMKNTGWIYAPQLIRTLTGEPLEEMIHLSERFAPNIYTDYARLALAHHHYWLAIRRSEADVIASNRRSNLRKADLYELGIHSPEFNLKEQRKELARKIKRLKDEMEED